jgi:hypothetical protein
MPDRPFVSQRIIQARRPEASLDTARMLDIASRNDEQVFDGRCREVRSKPRLWPFVIGVRKEESLHRRVCEHPGIGAHHRDPGQDNPNEAFTRDEPDRRVVASDAATGNNAWNLRISGLDHPSDAIVQWFRRTLRTVLIRRRFSIVGPIGPGHHDRHGRRLCLAADQTIGWTRCPVTVPLHFRPTRQGSPPSTHSPR